MAGDIKRQRKSWTLQDRSKVSINILRANLAEEGDEDAQLEIGKRLLLESSEPGVPERTQNENARLALYWLIKSSEQGNDEATQLLKECLKSGCGLTAQNILDVRTCVSTPKNEKLTFKAARLLYRKLSNGEEFITTAQLLARMNVKRKYVTFETGNGMVHGENLHDEDIVDKGQQQHDTENLKESNEDADPGEQALKNVDLNLTYTVPSSHPQSDPVSNLESRNIENSFSRLQSSHTREMQTSDLQFAMTQSGKKLTLNDLLNVAKDFNLGRIPEVSVDERKKILSRHKWDFASFINIFILQLTMLAVLGNQLQFSNALMYLLHLGITYSSYNLFLWKLRFENFKDWRGAFGSVLKEGSWTTKKFKVRLSQRFLLPYLAMLSIGSQITCQQNSVLSVAVGITAMLSIQLGVNRRVLPSWQRILIISITVMCNQSSVFVKILGEEFAEQTQFLRHQTMISAGNNFQPFSISIYSCIVCLILLTTVKRSLHRILSETLPEIVFTLWLIGLTTSFIDYNKFMLGLFTALTVCGIMILICSRLKTWKVILTMCSGVMVLIIVGLILNEHHGKALEQVDIEANERIRFLEWEEYDKTCHRKAWNTQSLAATQIKCSALYDDPENPALVKWKGRISIVKVEKLSRSLGETNLQNVVFDISVGILPSQKDDESRNWQSYLPGSSDSENLAPASLIIRTDVVGDEKKKQNLVDHVLNFRTGDKIEFIGKLKGSTSGSLKPQINEVQSLQCLSCAIADYGAFMIDKNESRDCLLWLKDAWRLKFQLDHSWFLNFMKLMYGLF